VDKVASAQFAALAGQDPAASIEQEQAVVVPDEPGQALQFARDQATLTALAPLGVSHSHRLQQAGASRELLLQGGALNLDQFIQMRLLMVQQPLATIDEKPG